LSGCFRPPDFTFLGPSARGGPVVDVFRRHFLFCSSPPLVSDLLSLKSFFELGRQRFLYACVVARKVSFLVFVVCVCGPPTLLFLPSSPFARAIQALVNGCSIDLLRGPFGGFYLPLLAPLVITFRVRVRTQFCRQLPPCARDPLAPPFQGTFSLLPPPVVKTAT